MPHLTCWISFSCWPTASRRCLRSVSEESSSRRMELLRPSACCNFWFRSSISMWDNLNRSNKSLFSCSCGSTELSEEGFYKGFQVIIICVKPQTKKYMSTGICSCLCGNQLLYSGHFRNVRMEPQLELILLM